MAVYTALFTPSLSPYRDTRAAHDREPGSDDTSFSCHLTDAGIVLSDPRRLTVVIISDPGSEMEYSPVLSVTVFHPNLPFIISTNAAEIARPRPLPSNLLFGL